MRVLGLVGNGLCLHDGGGQQPTSACRRVEGARPKLTSGNWPTLALSGSQVSKLSHVQLARLEAAMLDTGRSLRRSRGRKKGTEQAHPGRSGPRAEGGAAPAVGYGGGVLFTAFSKVA